MTRYHDDSDFDQLTPYDEIRQQREKTKRKKQKRRNDDRNSNEKRFKSPESRKPRCKTIDVSVYDWRGDISGE